VIVEQKMVQNKEKGGGKKLTIINYTFERIESFKYLGVKLNEDKSPNRFTRMNKKC
jgi:hypothetical protein